MPTPNISPSPGGFAGLARGQSAEGFTGLLESCKALGKRAGWRPSCEAAAQIDLNHGEAVRAFTKPALPLPPQRRRQMLGLVTGYYEPLLRWRHPAQQSAAVTRRMPPLPDLLTIDMASMYPELKNPAPARPGSGNKVAPYRTRTDIESGRGVERAGGAGLRKIR